jgi:putative nucleotidyltransferase with HDIG domain
MLTAERSQSHPLADLWLDGSTPSEGDLAAARSLAARIGVFEGLRPFPAVVQELVEYIGRPDFKVERVRQMIEADPALAARIMRVANSVAFRAYEPCTSVSNAIVRIGATNLAHLSMAMAAMTFFKDLGGAGTRIRDHSAGTAAVARELAFRMGRSVVASRVLLAGLLHDIGKLLLLQTGERDYVALINGEPSPNSAHKQEMKLLGFDHAMLGGHVLARWNLPEPLPQIVGCHHQAKPTLGRTAIGNSGVVPMAIATLRLADTVDWLLSQARDPEPTVLKNLALSPDGVHAGLGEDTLIDLWEDLRTARAEARSLFR